MKLVRVELINTIAVANMVGADSTINSVKHPLVSMSFDPKAQIVILERDGKRVGVPLSNIKMFELAPAEPK